MRALKITVSIVHLLTYVAHLINTRHFLGYVFRFVAAGIPRDGLHAHYDLGTELGKGSFANVYKAMHRATSKWFAVKMIQAEKIKKNPANHTGPGDAKKATAFAREISILEQLSHPNICQLKETFFHDSNISMK